MYNNNILVSIGLPVFNGENFVGESIESILTQTFKNFELIISDNASTDRTEKICRSYAKIDSRIRYHRNKKNIGAAPNYNKTFKLSMGKYFKWAAHDDLCEEEFLHKCIEVLEKNHEAVLAYPKTIKINENRDILEYYNVKLPTDSLNASIRYDALTHIGYKCYEVFGLIKRDALEKTNLIGSYANGDGVLLVQLGLLGKFIQVPEYLFVSRKHSNQSEAIYWKKLHSHSAWAEWFDPKNKRRRSLPYWKMYVEFLKAIRLSEKKHHRKCYKILIKKVFDNRMYLIREFLSPVTTFLRKHANSKQF